MTPTEVRTRVAEWLTAHQGAMTRSQYAADITAGTGWSIDYSRLGRYMREELPTGKQVLAHLDAYAKARDYDPVDLNHREPARSLDERAVIAAETQAAEAVKQTELMRRLLAHLAPESALEPDELAALVLAARTASLPLASHRPTPTGSS